MITMITVITIIKTISFLENRKRVKSGSDKRDYTLPPGRKPSDGCNDMQIRQRSKVVRITQAFNFKLVHNIIEYLIEKINDDD